MVLRLFSWIDQFLGRLFLRSVGLLFLVGGLVASYGGFTQLTTAWSARHWPAAQGEVVSSVVEGARAAVVYRYRVDGEEFTNDRVYVGEYSGMESHAEALVAAHPVGPVQVLYDPADPRSTVLDVRFPWTSMLLSIIGLIFLATAVGLFRKKASFGEMVSQVVDEI